MIDSNKLMTMINCLTNSFVILVEDAMDIRKQYIHCVNEHESEMILCQLDTYYYVLSMIASQLDSFGINPNDLGLEDRDKLDQMLRGPLKADRDKCLIGERGN